LLKSPTATIRRGEDTLLIHGWIHSHPDVIVAIVLIKKKKFGQPFVRVEEQSETFSFQENAIDLMIK